MIKNIIVYHNDNDGKCAGAIVACEFSTYGIDDNEFISYMHDGRDIKLPRTDEIDESTTVYIVDLSLNDTIFSLIKEAIAMGCAVIHIDHHKSTYDYINTFSENDKEIYSKVTSFIRMGMSGCLLTWIYACMNPDERLNTTTVNSVEFSLTEERSHVLFENSLYDNEERMYGIPMVVRFVDDNDIWRHYYSESKIFQLGFSIEPHDASDVELWHKLLYSSNGYELIDYITSGTSISAYLNSVNNSSLCKNGFIYRMEYNDNTHNVLCMNACVGNSSIFGRFFDEFDAVIKFNFNGEKWLYTMYTNDDSPIDASDVAKRYGGGGHQHAAGWNVDEFIFDKENIIKL